MWQRGWWQERIEAAWARRNVVWLMGVRRTGKTVLCQSLPDVEYFDCELPSVRRVLEDPESFLARRDSRRVVLDEIHRLDRPAELLKIAADHFPGVKLIATGSSTLGASARFRDTLAGRKRELWLTPMTLADVVAAGGTLEQRLAYGGLPPLFAGATDESDYQEWIDAYWAKDILELFRLERRRSFQRLLELLHVQSGGIFEANSLASPCEVSRTTIANYLAVLEATFVMHVVRPFSGNPSREITTAPRVYAFDTGFVRAFRGWKELRPKDEGELFEHLVLNELHAHLQQRSVRYWRTKRGEELDFVIEERGAAPIAIECKRQADEFDPKALQVFRSLHAGTRNYVVAMDLRRPYERRYGETAVRFVDLATLVQEIVPAPATPAPPTPSAARRSRPRPRKPGRS
jgi:predicted AAA+ superfamily ATPase